MTDFSVIGMKPERCMNMHQRFPERYESRRGHIHNLGLKAGIYTDAGNNTCGSMSDQDKAGIGAGIYGHEAQDAQLYFGDWGFVLLKSIIAGAVIWG